MVICLDVERCVGCGCCGDVCRQGALGIAEKALLYKGRCVGCGACVELCPVGALSLEEE